MDIDVKPEASGTATLDEKPSVPTTREEKEFELGIGDDSNAPNPTTPTKGKARAKAKEESASPEVTVVSPRQTRSSAKKALSKQEGAGSPARPRAPKAKPKNQENAEDEVQVLSSPDHSIETKGKSRSRATSSKKGHAETKVNKSEIRGTKAKGATIRGGTGEEGLESTVGIWIREAVLKDVSDLSRSSVDSIRRDWTDI
jgi:hypothetical protein